MDAVAEENNECLACGIDPDRPAGEAGVSKASERKEIASISGITRDHGKRRSIGIIKRKARKTIGYHFLPRLRALLLLRCHFRAVQCLELRFWVQVERSAVLLARQSLQSRLSTPTAQSRSKVG